MKSIYFSILIIVLLLTFFSSFFIPQIATAQTPQRRTTPTPLQTQGDIPATGVDLSLSPTFLSLITDPGEEVSSQFKVTNNNNFREYLNIKVAKFTASATGDGPVIADIEEGDTFAKWISFSEQEFTLDSNQTKVVTVTVNPPADAALGYYYALVVSRIGDGQQGTGQAVIAGSPALSVLVNVKSDNAKRELQLVEFKTDKFFYEYLPTTFEVKVKNTGNVHVVPVGDIFIDSVGKQDIAVIQANTGKGNVLPQTTRTYTAEWNDGFAVREVKMENGKEVLDENGKPEYTTKYDFTKADKFRIGKYTANLLLVYDNGERDIPVEATVSFWVIPWKILGIGLIVTLFALLGIKNTLFSNVKKLRRVFNG